MKRCLLFFVLSISLVHAEPIIIGISGGSGSGKTTLAERLSKALPQHSMIISEDAYYRDLSHLTFEECERVNFDHPDSIEFTMLEKHLIALKKGESIEQPIYDFKTHSRIKEKRTIEPTPIVIVEGILLFSVPAIRDQLDFKIFVDVDHDIRLIRRFERDINERGRQFENIKRQYLETVRPMHNAFVEPSKQYADLIVPIGGENEKALGFILSKLQSELLALRVPGE